MKADSLLYRSLILILCLLFSTPTLMSHNLYTVLQPVLAKKPNCSSKNSSASINCCSDCLGIGDDNYNLLFSCVYLSGVATLIPGGWLMDRFGNWLVIVFSGSTFIGFTLVAIGASLRGSVFMMPLLIAGSLVWGCGFLTAMLARHRIIAFWFRDKELFFAFGIIAALTRLVSLSILVFGEQIREAIGLQLTLWLSPIFGFVGALSAVLIAVMDRSGCTQLGKADRIKNEQKSLGFFDLRHAGVEYWLLVGSASILAGVYSTYQENTVEFFHEVFVVTKQKAAIYSSLMEAVAVAAFPITGIILEKTGRSSIFLTISILCLHPCLLLLAYAQNIHPVIASSGVGIIQCFYTTAGVASIALIVNSSILGMASAVAITIRAATLSILHGIVGAVVGHETDLPYAQKLQRWQHSMLVLVAVTFIAFVLAVSLTVISCIRGSALTSRRKMAATEEYEQIGNGNSSNEKQAEFPEDSQSEKKSLQLAER